MDRFYLIELKEVRAQEFRNLRQGNMIVQECGLKFNQLSKYAPHMLLGDMNMSRLMTHAQQVDADKLREQAKKNKKVKTGNYDYFQ